jgi:hypothetical protein
MSNIYRLSPVLWEGRSNGSGTAQTVYAIDRIPPPLTSFITCTARDTSDPAAYWDARTFNRLKSLDQYNVRGGITWFDVPAWLSFAASYGYTVSPLTSELTPFKDIYIVGP